MTTSDPRVVTAVGDALRGTACEPLPTLLPDRPTNVRRRHAILWSKNPDLRAWDVEVAGGEPQYRCLKCPGAADLQFVHVELFSWLVCSSCRRAAFYGFATERALLRQSSDAKAAALHELARCGRMTENGSTVPLEPEAWLQQVNRLVGRTATRDGGVTVKQVRRIAEVVNRLGRPEPVAVP